MTCLFVIYNVGLGQCVGVLPVDQRNYAMMIDCGFEGTFHPIDSFGQCLPRSSESPPRPELGNLILTNYDHDHFGDISTLHKQAKIKTVLMPNNMSMTEVLAVKPQKTEALEVLREIRSTYTKSVTDWDPPYKRSVFTLMQKELSDAGISVQTNHLSQLVFVTYGETTICFPGDLEVESWGLMLRKPEVQGLLRETSILIASHHGRENGYNPEVFSYCSPICVILSDKAIVHATQEDMSAVYANHVAGSGISYTPSTGKVVQRKTLTTRNDGHILISVPIAGLPTFTALKI